ncbi:hypothetical protein BH09ACT13_BH09ACT13_10380 [soil metagenome]
MATRTRLVARRVGFLEACLDPKLLGLTLSPRQKELAQLMQENELVIAAAGRQSGKSFLAAALLVWNILLRPDLDERAGATVRIALCVANSREQAQIVLGYCRSLIERSPLLRSRLLTTREERLVFERGSILAMPCQDRLMRGLVASVVCLDEFGHFLSESDGPRVADRVFHAVRPSLATFGSKGRLVAVSTPMGSDNLFAQLHARAAAGELANAGAFQASTKEMNPKVPTDFLEGERLTLGELDFAREYEAQFTSGGSSFFEDDAVRSVVGRYRELSPDEGTGWLVGFDPSFSVDPAAAAVVGRSRADRMQLVVARVERWLPKGARLKRRQTTAARQNAIDRVLDAVARLSTAYGQAPVVTDQHVPATVVEGLRRRGVPRVIVRAWTAQSQTDAFRALRSHVVHGSITLPDEPQLVSELLRLTTRVQAGGSQVRIPRSGDSHCDLAVSVAAATLELDTRGVPGKARTWSSFKSGGAGSISERERDELLARYAEPVDLTALRWD